MEELVKGYTAGPALTEPSSSSLPYLPEKEGRETGKVVEPEEDQDDVCVQKRMAQVGSAGWCSPCIDSTHGHCWPLVQQHVA